MIKSLHLEHFILSYSSVESNKVRLKNALTTFQIEVHDLHPENEWKDG